MNGEVILLYFRNKAQKEVLLTVGGALHLAKSTVFFL